MEDITLVLISHIHTRIHTHIRIYIYTHTQDLRALGAALKVVETGVGEEGCVPLGSLSIVTEKTHEGCYEEEGRAKRGRC